MWINYVCILSLIISISAKHIPPIIFWIPAFFGLAFPYIVLLNAIFLLYWFIQFKHIFLLGGVFLAFSLPTMYRYVQFSSIEPVNNARAIKVTSYNSMLFDLYNWKHNKETRPKIFGTLTENMPGILCLQEFYTSENPKDYNNIDSVKRIFNLENVHAEYTYTQFDVDHWGIATFSKYPIINKGKIIFHTSSNNICIFRIYYQNTGVILP